MGVQDSFIIARIAKLYYIDGLKQNQIAKIYNISTMQVSRYLKMAIDKKIIQFHIKMPFNIDVELGKKIAKKYNFLECVVIDDDENEKEHKTAHYLASYISTILKDQDIVGISWGKGIHDFADSLPYTNLKNIRIVQMCGGSTVGDEYMYTSSHIITNFCSRFKDSIPIYLNAPFFVSDINTKHRLLEDVSIKKNYELVQNAHINIVGCSVLDTDFTMKKMGIILEDDILELKEKGAIGEIGSHFIDAKGDVVEWSKSALYGGVSLSQIRKGKQVVCIASGKEKYIVLKAILLKQFIDVLIINSSIAKKLI